ncbi:MAG: response regulator [Anaerolineae bacterium]|nr:response regulator [Anaerolineae bacterium]
MPRERILVVDDEPDVLRVCERILVGNGYMVSTVGSGFEAVQLASAQHFDCLLTDIKMPGMDGLDVAEAARSVNQHLVCIIMTGYSTMDTAIEALRLGVEEFIIKPFSPQDLITAVSRALEKERLRQESARLRALLPLFEANKVFMSTTELPRLAQQVVNTAIAELRADRAVLFLGEEPATDATGIGGFRPVAMHGVHRSELKAWAAAVEGASLGEGAAILPETAVPEALRGVNGSSLLACNIHSKKGAIGVLVLKHDEPHRVFGEADREFLSVLCSQAGIAFENAALFEELRHAYEDLKQLDYMKSEFISIAAHELRTPLAILMGYAGILEGMVSPDQKPFAGIILRSAQRLRALLDEMLDLESLERGASLMRLEAINLAEVVEETVEALRPLADNRGHTIRVVLPEGGLRLTTDRDKLGMILTNLVSNAIKFTHSGGQIEIRATERSGFVQVDVEDNGIGIAPSEWERIFERFYQVEDSLTREHEGMGLGLSIAKGMVELLGGRIWLDSRVGVGSTFSFSIPISLRQTDDNAS